MEKIIERKVVAVLVLLLLVASSIVSFTGNMPTVYTVKADNNWEDCGNNASAHHNTSWLNVTIESKYPRILWYDIQRYTGAQIPEGDDGFAPAGTSESDWVSIRNNMTTVDNNTWLRFVINISSDQGWENIEWINLSGWHDNGTDDDGTRYNATGNHGSNRNFFLYYENITGTPYYNISWPTNRTELTIGNFTEFNTTDALGIEGSTHTHNLTFEFKPGYQFRYAPGPDGTGDTWENHSVQNTEGFPHSDDPNVVDYATSSWSGLNNPWSWNFNISVTNKGMRGGDVGGTYPEGSFTSYVLDEFGVYSYTEIVQVSEETTIMGAPGDNASTASSNPFHGSSQNASISTRSNGNYSLVVNLSDLKHSAYDIVVDPEVKENLTISKDKVWIRGGNRTTPLNFTSTDVRKFINLYGNLSSYTDGTVSSYERHEVNGTIKYTGEVQFDGENGGADRWPDHYSDYSEYGSHNRNSTYIEFTVDIPNGQWAGKYSTNVYYWLRTETSD